MRAHTLAFIAFLTAASAPFAWSALDRPLRAASAWEYRAVGFADRHSDALGALMQAFAGQESSEEEESLLERAMSVEDRLTQQMEDMLNTYGAEGWELVHVGPHRMVFKRQAP